MDLLHNLALGFNEALLLSNLWYCFVGVFIGTAVGVIPGLGPLATMSLLMPLTFALQPSEALIMLAGIYYGAQYEASTTAILLNLPGETSPTASISSRSPSASSVSGRSCAISKPRAAGRKRRSARRTCGRACPT